MRRLPYQLSRGRFIGSAASAALPFTARSSERMIGSNDRIQVGDAIGCGHRAQGHRRMLMRTLYPEDKDGWRYLVETLSMLGERGPRGK